MSQRNHRVTKEHVLWNRLFVAFVLFFSLFSFKTVDATGGVESMLGYWKFDGNGNDSSGHENTITNINFLPNAPTTTFPNTQSASFEASGNNTFLPTQNNLQPTQSFTFALWIKLDSFPSTSTKIAGNYASSGHGFSFDMDPVGNVSFGIGSNGTFQETTSATALSNDHQWHHLIGTWSPGTAKLYIDGSFKGMSSTVSAPTYVSTNFSFGSFKGQIDDMRLYGRLLSTVEIGDLATGKHTSASWTGGGGNSDYRNPLNWNINAIPDPYTWVTITTASPQPKFISASQSVAGLKIQTDASLDLTQYNLTINDSGVFANDGTLSLWNDADQSLNGFVNDTDSGIILINCPDIAVAGSQTIKTGSAYNHLSINTCTDNTISLTEDTIINGNVSLLRGTMDTLASSAILLKGSWNKTGGSFNPGTGTVTLDGTNQNISGSNTFYNLKKTSSATDTLTFEAGSTQIISNSLTLRGSASGIQLLRLRSTTSGTHWLVDPRASRDVSSLDIMDGNNINSLSIALAGRNVNSGNNINWSFDTAAPDLTLDTVSSPTSDINYPITGRTLDTVTIITHVQFQMETIGGSWTECSANDGSFDESDEDFTCTPPSLSDGLHTMYIQSIDANGNGSGTTKSASFTVDTSAPTVAQVTAVATQGNDTTPDYTFSTTEAGTITYGGDCSSSTTVATTGNNTVTFNALSEGSHANCTIKVTDAAGNMSSALSVSSFTVAIPPTISAILTSVETNSASITWNTDENASSIVDYGKTIQYDTTLPESDTPIGVTSHTLSLSPLSACTTYHFRVRSRDTSLNEGISPDGTFKTSGCEQACPNGDPDKPDLKDVKTVDATSIKLFYDDSTEKVDHYELKYGLNSDEYAWSEDDIGGKNDGVYTVQDLEPATRYYFKMRAVNDCGKSDWTNPLSSTTDQKENALTTNETPSDEATPLKTEEKPTEIPPKQSASVDQEHVDEQSSSEPDGEDQTQGTVSDSSDFESPLESNLTPDDSLNISSVEVAKGSNGKKLKLSGKGPPNSILTIYIYSSPIVLKVKTDKDGNWSYTLDKDMDNGVHKVFVAVTDKTGKITRQSQAIPFVKTAEAATIVTPSQAAEMERAGSPTELWYKTGLFWFVVITAIGLVLALLLIGYYKTRTPKETNVSRF